MCFSGKDDAEHRRIEPALRRREWWRTSICDGGGGVVVVENGILGFNESGVRFNRGLYGEEIRCGIGNAISKVKNRERKNKKRIELIGETIG